MVDWGLSVDAFGDGNKKKILEARLPLTHPVFTWN